MAAIVTLTMNPALDIATSTDRVVPTHKLRCAAPRYDPGGGGINVARAVHALGGDAVAIFPIGGPAGEMIRHMLQQEGVDHHAITISGFTRESLAVEELTSGKQFRFILPGPEIVAKRPGALSGRNSQRRLRRRNTLWPAAACRSGLPDDFYARMAELARARRASAFVLDTSGPALKQSGKGIYLLKPSLRELADLAGREIRSQTDAGTGRASGDRARPLRDRRPFSGRRGCADGDRRRMRALCRNPGRGQQHGRCRRQHAGGHRSRPRARTAAARCRSLRHGGGSGGPLGQRDPAVPAQRCRATVCRCRISAERLIQINSRKRGLRHFCRRATNPRSRSPSLKPRFSPNRGSLLI